jgi:hypothetical protein
MKLNAPLQANKGFNLPGSMFRKSAPPSMEKSRKVSLATLDGVNLTSAATNETKVERSSGFLKAALLGGMAALSLATAMAPPAAAQALCIQAPCQVEQLAENWRHEHPGAPVEMLREADGDIVFNVGINDQVVHPDLVDHYTAPGADAASWNQRGETVCKQALDLGGRCDSDDIAYVTTPHGTLIVEQNEAHSIDVYSQNGGHINMKVKSGGVDVKTAEGNAFFYNNGHIGRY